MKVKRLYEVTRGILITFGIISIFSPRIFAFPWFVVWSVCLASPIWNGALVAEQKCYQRKDWEASFALGILSITGTSVQFAAAIASPLLGPYCYCSLAEVAGPSYLGCAVLFPLPHADFANLCEDPSHYKWYHLTLQILDLCLSLAIFCASLGFVMIFL
ncbi:PREDICTED: transmembrane protein 212 [Nipponia nippon]|uniref:transmembrane protein 212 n=1 Tax=Nipponia nippon TaxID=128390 RepID=UPI000510FE13|nr:PREDICTED: transmembrane protein 212 [Nipponia nippon]